MRKRNFKLIRETLVWPHRRKGASLVALPSNVPSENYRFFKLFGSDADDFRAGVGDYDDSLGSYAIFFHVHGKNLMGGEEFMAVHSALNISKIAPAIVSGCYTTTPLPEHNGTVVIGPQHVKFKKKTPYTLALRMKYFTSASRRNIAMRFDYSDGTYDVPSVATSSRDFYICFTSDPEKDLVAISSHAETATNVRFGLEEFGLYEGAYSEYEDAYEPYDGMRGYLSVDSPLLKIDHSADEIDVINGKEIRKIQKFRIDETCDISQTDDECIFEIKLPAQMAMGKRIISPFGPLSADSESGISRVSMGGSILFKASSEIKALSEMREYLSSNPFDIIYVRMFYEHRDIDKMEIPAFEKELTLELLSSEEPSKTVAEYI
ncbi:MAG: hypothetical protein E7673_02105 [Ruminococcaceae bacterium]|nr:hypothetical protein [Oscillospiraceae bacterium]